MSESKRSGFQKRKRKREKEEKETCLLRSMPSFDTFFAKRLEENPEKEEVKV